MIKSADIIQQLSESQIYRDYEKAFNNATLLPLALRPEVIWQPALRDKKNENAFCALMAKSSRSCAACLQVQDELTQGEPRESHTVSCFAGLSDTAVPLIVGGNRIGFLQTGQVAWRTPTEAGFSRVSRQLLNWGTRVDLTKLEDAYFHSLVLSRPQYESMVRLLEIFAQHLSVTANQCLVQKENHESPMISRAKKIIQESGDEPLSLEQMAKALNVSTFYFCKMFKKATGLTFTDYLARTRIERAKNLLLNPNVRISEAAYDSGFASITHFNRVFKRVVGQSPTEYRQKLPAFEAAS
jgi:AraC-like DNA-binding protein/ligand-binding sensor protein